MRKLSLLLTLLFCSVVAFAQKIDLDKLNFKASYLQLPTNPFPEEYTTFSTKFIANGINLNDAGYANNESDLESVYFKITGFKRVTTGGHFTIKVQIDGYDMGKPETVKKETTTKDKDGKETTTVSYTLKFKYLVPMMYTITDLNGKIIKDGPIAEGSIEKTYETSSYSTTATLEKYWNDNAATTKRGLLGGFISEKLSLFQARLENEIGYVPRTNTDILWTTDSPKHPENDAFKKTCEDTKNALSEMTAMIPLNPLKMKPIIAYFDSVLVKYTKDEKPDRKLRYGAWYNMSTIYYWLEDFDNAIRCGEGLIANDYDKGDGKDLKIAAERLKAKLASGIIKTRHYVRDVSNAKAPEMTQAQRDEEEVRQNALKDKAMREAAEREVTSQRRPSSGAGGILDVDRGISNFKSLLFKKKEKEVEKENVRSGTSYAEEGFDNINAGKNGDAIKIATEGIMKHPDKSLLFFVRGTAYNNVGQKSLAQEDFNQGVNLSPEQAVSYSIRGNFYRDNRSFEKAIIDYEKGLSIAANDISILHNRGLAYSNWGKYEESIRDYNKVIAIDPNQSVAYNNRSISFVNTGKIQEAIDDAKKAISISPKYSTAFYTLASAYEKMKDFDKAINTYTEIITLKPEAVGYNNRGWALSNTGKFAEAIPDFDQAIKLSPSDGIFFKNRGNAKNKIGQYESALIDLNIAVEQKISLHYKSLSNRGDSYLGLGKFNEALADYEAALLLKPDFQEAIDGKVKTLAKIKK
jgi:tetratricopeptide (TPR) repeat protein